MFLEICNFFEGVTGESVVESDSTKEVCVGETDLGALLFGASGMDGRRVLLIF